jgi:anaerobic ribonucleoside-triphosphate reductase activating protein
LSILGGEPLSKLSDNRKQVILFAKEVKEKFPNKTIFLWSGYLLDEIQADDSMKDILKYIDVLVDGPFIEEQKDLSIPFRGSRNQRILKKGKDF